MDKNDLLELLLAERVLGMASKLRAASAPEDRTQRAAWRKAHPTSEFIPHALARIRDAAAVIRDASRPERITEQLHDSLEIAPSDDD